jgi:hypothetical protein
MQMSTFGEGMYTSSSPCSFNQQFVIAAAHAADPTGNSSKLQLRSESATPARSSLIGDNIMLLVGAILGTAVTVEVSCHWL